MVGWQFNSDYVGSKFIITTTSWQTTGTNSTDYIKPVKYDGKILGMNMASIVDNGMINVTDKSTFALTIADTDTGWAESINPNNDEVKVFMNGWKVLWNNGTRYNLWCAIYAVANGTTSTDLNAYPVGTASQLTVATTGTTSVTVADASMFKAGDAIVVLGVTPTTVASISGNVITFTVAPNALPIGTVVARLDTPATDTRILVYCKTMIAPNYDGYKLHYKLINPEIITDANTRVRGDIPKFNIGDNYVTIDSGIVLGELANPASDGAGGYIINSTYSTQVTSILKNKADISPFAVYKNLVCDTNWIMSMPGLNTYGLLRIDEQATLFDVNATYTVDYKILAYQAPQVGTIFCNYQLDILHAIQDVQNSLNGKQTHDSALDALVDLSMYEIFTIKRTHVWFAYPNSSYVNIDFLFIITQKKIVPTITIGSFRILGFNGTAWVLYNTFTLNAISKESNNEFLIRYTSTDPATITAIKSYGFEGFIQNVIFDCRGRV